MELRFNDPKLKFPGVTVRFLPSGKVLVVLEGTGVHYTLHPGHHSGVIDFHKTNERLLEGDPARYETLAAIGQHEIVRNLEAVGKDPVMDLLRLLRPIRLGWIARRRLGVVAFPTEVELDGVSGIRIKAGPAEWTEPLKSLMRVPEFIDDILLMPNAAFLLFDCRRPTQPPYGVLFKVVDSHGVFSLCWIRLRDLKRWGAATETIFAERFKRFWIQPANVHK
jgi:hypothetical protein